MLGGFLVLTPFGHVRAEDAKKTEKKSEKKTVEIPEISLFEAVRSGDVAVEAEGSGDGRMTVSLTNRSDRQLKVDDSLIVFLINRIERSFAGARAAVGPTTVAISMTTSRPPSRTHS